jgi:hypothetical protein
MGVRRVLVTLSFGQLWGPQHPFGVRLIAGSPDVHTNFVPSAVRLSDRGNQYWTSFRTRRALCRRAV